RYGTMSPDELLNEAQQRGITHLVLTDINCTAGIIEFTRQAVKKNIHPIAGVDFRNGVQPMFVALAKNACGFAHINEFLSNHLHQNEDFDARAPQLKDTYIIYPFPQAQKNLHPDELHENEFVGIDHHELNSLRWSEWIKHPKKLVLMHPISFRNKRDFNAHRLLRCIDLNTLLSKLPVEEQARIEDTFERPAIPDDLKFLEEHAQQLIQSCSIDFQHDKLSHQNQQYYCATEEEDIDLLKKLCSAGLSYRYPQANEEVMRRLSKEIELIIEKKFVSYFLINWDIVHYARSKNYYYVGRGSGANSIVAYLLRITDVDPIELDLYFERFINLFRESPPDFDIDFSWRDREDITRYIFQKFRNVTLLGAFNTFQYAATIRELGKVFGLPKHEIDALCDQKMPEGGMDQLHHLVLRYAEYLHDFPNYISIHSAGILITEKPIYWFGATFMPPKGFPTAQFDMYQAEDVKINKLDILSQRGLGKIKDTLSVIRYNQPDAEPFDIHDIQRFKQDHACNELLRTASAMGCFYVESPAMRMLLTKLQTHHYIGLVAASSVIRPGVSSSGMMREYILRERIPEKRNDAPKPLLELMPETHGVMVYQEDVIKVAHEFAGLTLGEADVLRRGMSGKFRGREEFEHARARFLQGAIERGHPKELVVDVWRQVESFAGYAFAKGHSASYAVESYQCLFLKANFPLEYMVATVNNEGGFFRPEFYLHEARMLGAHIEGPCVQHSRGETVIHGKTIYIGFHQVKSLEHSTIARIEEQQPFEHLEDFLDRVPIGLEQAILLARIGALKFTGTSKKELLWKLHLWIEKGQRAITTASLFSPQHKAISIPALEHHWVEDAYDEIELLGFPLCNPFDLIDLERNPELKRADFFECHADQFTHRMGQRIWTIGYRVTIKPTSTNKGERMFFGTFLDRRGKFIDSVHFPEVAKKYPMQGWGLYVIQGVITEEFDAITIQANYARKLQLITDPRSH
ncbi:MAG: PHP domain-containing protein, partial [Flavobacteriales bacterium]